MSITGGSPPRFTASTADDARKPPVPFQLEGVFSPESGRREDETWTENFAAVGAPPMSASLSLGDAWLLDDTTGQRVPNPGICVTFIRDCLPRDDAARFMALVHDRDRLVRGEALAKVMEYLVERYSGRPTGRPSSSGPGGSGVASGAEAAPSWPPSLP